MSGSLRNRAAQLLILLSLAGLTRSDQAIAQDRTPRYAVRLQAEPPQTSATSSTTGLPVSVALERLERQLVGLEAGSTSSGSLAEVDAEAQQVLDRATTAADRIRARRIRRRVKHLVEDSYRVTPDRTYGVAQASFVTGESTAVPSSRLVEPCDTCEPRLGRLAALASRLSQYGMPQEETPTCATEMMPVPMATAVACAPPPTMHYFNIEALGWWVKGDALPALVTTSPIGTPQDQAGVLSDPSSNILFGDGRVNNVIRAGGRVLGGVWLDDFQTIAVEGFYFGLPTVTASFSESSTFSGGMPSGPILARPFYNTNPAVDADSSSIIAFPNYDLGPAVLDLDGTINIQETSSVQSAGGGARYALGSYDSDYRVFLLGAYRYFNLTEQLRIATSTSASTPPFPLSGGQLDVVDRFGTKNSFNGAEIGIATEIHRGRWSWVAEKRFAMGNMNEQLRIDGRTSAVYDTFTASYEGGLLAQPSNIGTFTRNRFAFIPQYDLKIGYQVLPSLRLTFGYTLIFVSRVIRPGNQIVTNVNTTQIAGRPLVGPADPSPSTKDVSIWMQGISLGLDLRF